MTSATPPRRIAAIPGVTIRILGKTDAAAFRDIRLEGLRLHPESFGSSIAEEERLTEDAFARRIPAAPPDVILGAFQSSNEATPALVGILGFHVYTHDKQRHKAGLWGMYVRQAWRRQGIAAALLAHAIEHARSTPGIEMVQLTVAVGNRAARGLYDEMGFVVYGLEKRALKLGASHYLDEELMALDLGSNR
jgi:ribosomal protein S18 acetylase RimI-like enzyme